MYTQSGFESDLRQFVLSDCSSMLRRLAVFILLKSAVDGRASPVFSGRKRWAVSADCARPNHLLRCCVAVSSSTVDTEDIGRSSIAWSQVRWGKDQPLKSRSSCNLITASSVYSVHWGLQLHWQSLLLLGHIGRHCDVTSQEPDRLTSDKRQWLPNEETALGWSDDSCSKPEQEILSSLGTVVTKRLNVGLTSSLRFASWTRTSFTPRALWYYFYAL